MDKNSWKQLTIMCQGKGKYEHFPAEMIYERMGSGVRTGAIYRCTICNGRKFVWETKLRGNVEWKWKEAPNRGKSVQ